MIRFKQLIYRHFAIAFAPMDRLGTSKPLLRLVELGTIAP
jgi:hypothetical protein